MDAVPESVTWPRSVAAGFVAGVLGGELFLAAGLIRDAGDFVTISPTPAFAFWVLMRSIALYGLLFGGFGLIVGGVLHLLRRRAVFPLVSGAVLAATAFAYSTAWWQLDVLSGVPPGAGQRVTGALWQAGLAIAVGWVGAILVSRLRWSPATKSAAVVAATGVLLLGTTEWALALRRPAQEGPWKPSRVVLVGLDGLTLRVLSPLLRDGEVPTFQRLIDEGAWGSLLTYGVASSPVVWTSVATGKKARDHGITDFVTAARGQYRARPVRSSDRRVPAIWNILGHAGRTVAVVNWLVTSPPEPVRGTMVTGLAWNRGLRTFPGDVEAEITEVLAGFPPPDNARESHRSANLDGIFAVAEHLSRTRSPDFLAVYDRSADNVQHTTWKHYQPAAFDAELWDVAASGDAPRGDTIPDTYVHLDRRLGQLLDLLDDDALLIVVSDHGQLAARRPRVRLHLDRVLAALGFAELVEGSLDTARSRAYALFETRFSPRWRVNLNLIGREPRGIVAAGDAEALTSELVERLRGIRFADGRPLFGEVTRGANQRTDVVVAPSAATRDPRRALDDSVELGGELRPYADFADLDTKISGDHDHQGVIFVHGQGVRRGPIGQRVVTTPLQEILHRLTDRVDALDSWLPLLGRLGLIERATTLDLTPTILRAMGLPIARDMAGRPLTELLPGSDGGWVDSYDGLADGVPSPEASPAEDKESNDEVLDRLEALGYVG
ncbi:MAG: alkaline phosphatase family protein [Thermoanaerobaculia bacterium]